MNLYNSILESKLSKPIEALHSIEQSIQKYGYQHVALSFNGGKDCTVLLELLRAAIAHLQVDLSKLQIIYFKEDDEFEEIKQFMRETQQRYSLHFTECDGNFKDALYQLFRSHPADAPPFRAVFMGQRACDPGGTKITHCSPSDVNSGWPAFDRLNPLLQWSYADVWQFLFQFQVPYCELYAQGFTSLGHRHNSQRNTALWDEQAQRYKHAAELKDESQERQGRLGFAPLSSAKIAAPAVSLPQQQQQQQQPTATQNEDDSSRPSVSVTSSQLMRHSSSESTDLSRSQAARDSLSSIQPSAAATQRMSQISEHPIPPQSQ